MTELGLKFDQIIQKLKRLDKPKLSVTRFHKQLTFMKNKIIHNVDVCLLYLS